MASDNTFNRRNFLTSGTAAAMAALGGAASVPPAAAAPPAATGRSGDGLALVNGRIHTFDSANSVVDTVQIRDGKFVSVGRRVGGLGPERVINLRGRTVIPGLIDNHCHFIRIGQAAGYDMRRLEAAFSIAEVQQTIATYAAGVPDGEFLTALRGLALRQWSPTGSPARHLTLLELDDAAPRHPVIISQGTNGQTNSLGRDRLRALGVTVSDTGSVNDDQAYIALSQFLTLETKKRELLRASEYALSVGLTGFIDEHGSVGAPGTAGFLDRVSGHDHILALWREGQLPVRVRARFGVNSPSADPAELLPIYVNNRWDAFGDDLFKQAGIGEWAPRGSLYQQSLQIMAARPIQYQQHLISTNEIETHLNALEQFEIENPQYNVGDLYWSGGHMDGLTEAQVLRSNNLGWGIIPQGWQYLTGSMGPNFRMILEHATVPVGTGTDGARVAPLNPWAMIYFMTTGRHSGGVAPAGAADRTISRHDALKLYAGPQQGWFCKEEDRFGGIGVGRYADLAVLAADVFDPVAVPDDQLRKMTSIMTIVGGNINYDTGLL